MLTGNAAIGYNVVIANRFPHVRAVAVTNGSVGVFQFGKLYIVYRKVVNGNGGGALHGKHDAYLILI
jgi:hypothetical protein